MQSIRDEIYAVNKNIIVLDELKNKRDKVLCVCKIDGYEWRTVPYDLIRGSGCHQCGGVPRYTTETFKSRLSKISPSIKITGEYVRAHNKIDWECGVCNSKNSSLACGLINGTGCPKCAISRRAKEQTKPHHEYVGEVEKLVGKEYDVIGKYEGTDSPVLMKHNLCGESFETRPHNFLRGTRCPKCNGGVRKKTTEYFKQEVSDVSDGEYEFIDEYIDNRRNHKFKHIECGRVFETSPDSFLNQNTRCTHCFFLSNGETEIQKTLERLGVYFVQEKSFDDLIHIGKLRFDFYLPEVNLCIEFDGRQHFESIPHWGGNLALEETQKRDIIKNNYCLDNNINLLRIKHKIGRAHV